MPSTRYSHRLSTVLVEHSTSVPRNPWLVYPEIPHVFTSLPRNHLHVVPLYLPVHCLPRKQPRELCSCKKPQCWYTRRRSGSDRYERVVTCPGIFFLALRWGVGWLLIQGHTNTALIWGGLQVIKGYAKFSATPKYMVYN